MRVTILISYTPPYQHEHPLNLDLSAVSSLYVSGKVAVPACTVVSDLVAANQPWQGAVE